MNIRGRLIPVKIIQKECEENVKMTNYQVDSKVDETYLKGTGCPCIKTEFVSWLLARRNRDIADVCFLMKKRCPLFPNFFVIYIRGSPRVFLPVI